MAVLNSFAVPVDGGTGSTLMPKLAYRFRVLFIGLGQQSDLMTEATRNVVSVGRPSLTHDDIIVDAYNSRIKLAGKHTWNDIQIVLRDDLNSNVVKAIGSQLSEQLNHETQSGPAAGTQYKFSVQIQILDGDQSTPIALDTWDLAGCYIKNVEYGELNYANSEVVQVTMTLSYDNASHHMGNDVAEDILASDTAQGIGSAADRTATGGE